MSRVTRCIFKTRVDVGFFKVGKVLEDLLRRHSAGKHFKHMAHRDSHAANRWFTYSGAREENEVPEGGAVELSLTTLPYESAL